MVFLTSLDIVDTGYLSVNTRTSQLATGSRVNSGTALRLKGVDFDITTSGNLDKAVSPARYPTTFKDHEERALISVNPTEVKVEIRLNSDNTTTANPFEINDMSLLAQIVRLPMTRGWKALYYPVDVTATDSGSATSRKRDSQLIHQIGVIDTVENQGNLNLTLWTGETSASSKNLTDVRYLPVRFDSSHIRQEPGNTIVVTLVGVVTG